uniref:PIG-P domain-containing protein n=1 Tax=Polytomella parva TaxID=51329 RepID=A0A7S0V806_9CHLO
MTKKVLRMFNSQDTILVEEDASGIVGVYSFVGHVATKIVFVVFLVWSLTPERALQSWGFTYYPLKYWAIAFPAWLVISIFLFFVGYESFNLMSVKSMNSRSNFKDRNPKSPSSVGLESYKKGTDVTIPPLCHIPASIVNDVLYQ